MVAYAVAVVVIYIFEVVYVYERKAEWKPLPNQKVCIFNYDFS